MLEICKFDTSIYDLCLLSSFHPYQDYALATWEGVQFIRFNLLADTTTTTYTVEVLPYRLRERESINNVIRFKENVLIYADGSQLVLWDRAAGREIAQVWMESQIRSIKEVVGVGDGEEVRDPEYRELRRRI